MGSAPRPTSFLGAPERLVRLRGRNCERLREEYEPFSSRDEIRRNGPQLTSTDRSPGSFRSRGSRAVGAISLNAVENPLNPRLQMDDRYQGHRVDEDGADGRRRADGQR